MSWLSSFKNILHAIEVASTLAAPIISAVVDPKGGNGKVIAGLMTQATSALVNVQAISDSWSTPMTGEQRGAVVQAGTDATFNAINAILQSQGKPPISQSITSVVGATVKTVVEGMKTIGETVGPVNIVPDPATATVQAGMNYPK